MNTRTAVLLVAGMTITAMAGCSSSPSTSDAPSAQTSSPAASPTQDPAVGKALAAYEAYREAANAARENPVPEGKPWPKAADFEAWSYDPARSDTAVFVHALAESNAEYRGQPPTTHVTLGAVDLQARPYPEVNLTDCQVPNGLYVPYDRDSGKRLKLVGNANLTDPFLSQVQVVAVNGRWGVRSVKLEQGRACQP